MIVVLIRHGHKGHMPFQDPELMPQGFDQAIHLAELIASHDIPKPTHCWYSDKIRTRQTLSEAILKFNPVCTETKNLSTRANNEPLADFRKKVQDFIATLSQRAQNKPDEVHFVCTHFDWIEESLTVIPSDQDLNSFQFAHWSPGQFILFEITNELAAKTTTTTEKDFLWKFTTKGVLK